MLWVIQGVFSFIATAAFGILFNAPKKTLFHCGLAGAIGWLIYFTLQKQGVDAVPASFAGAFVISIVAHILARRFKMPMIIFSVAGIIPLVPGGMAYNAMRHVVENDYLASIQYAARAFIITGAIVMGLVFAEVFMQLIFNMIRKRKAKAIGDVM
ncbi:threonine/serine exporter family protein [Viridibacillus sp. YIM B01967]|uniref:Threonine/serine exporter family protein n=1 Tax=Viridibacillus soli TaxID=2798301 RepID=A0ABS1H7V7_9BACL|nr:threonine/serine exporter family protein [Viridibacillus soli]MBK3495503.1 threonine/serine exporter family protein [Viridibacillus soli]